MATSVPVTTDITVAKATAKDSVRATKKAAIKATIYAIDDVICAGDNYCARYIAFTKLALSVPYQCVRNCTEI